MRALLKAERAEGLVMRDEPKPAIGQDDILIKVAKTGICGTDLHIWKWDEWARRTIPVPMVVGHEFAGTVGQCPAVASFIRPNVADEPLPFLSQVLRFANRCSCGTARKSSSDASSIDSMRSLVAGTGDTRARSTSPASSSSSMMWDAFCIS